ncbi:AMP-binding protein [Acuticoccus sp.]|uniref:AMP-binding protein n=1 Tax=Acuticoccus sp. TaxID=1904378 RepID=UPI003B525D05
MDAPRLDDLLIPLRAASSGRPAFVLEDGTTLGAADFDAMVARTAGWLRGQGIGSGDRVAVWLVNRIEWLAILFALARLDATLVAVNTRYRSSELHHILLSSNAKMLVMQPDFRRIDFPAVLSSLDASDLASLTTVAVLGEVGDPILGRTTVPFDPANATPDAGGRGDPDAGLIIFTTSGTTKAPKLVLHPQRTLALHSQRAAVAYGFDAPDAGFLAAMPFCGVFGLNAALAAIAGGATSHVVAMFDAEDTARRVEEGRLTHLFGSDEMFRRLVGLGRERLASLRVCGFGAFTPGLSDFLADAAEAGLPLCGLYGSSEVNALFSIQPADMTRGERLKGGGRPASDDADVRVRNAETGELLPDGEPGELEIRAPTNFVGYDGNAEATAAAVDPDGYFRTGDVGYTRGNGTFVYVARAGDAIRLSGFLTDPAEIEDVLKGLDGVADAQVVGVEVDGQTRPVAFVIAEGGGASEGAIVAGARERLAAYKVPLRVFTLEAFPTTQSANGLKIQRAKLRSMAAERLATENA